MTEKGKKREREEENGISWGMILLATLRLKMTLQLQGRSAGARTNLCATTSSLSELQKNLSEHEHFCMKERRSNRTEQEPNTPTHLFLPLSPLFLSISRYNSLSLQKARSMNNSIKRKTQSLSLTEIIIKIRAPFFLPP